MNIFIAQGGVQYKQNSLSKREKCSDNDELICCFFGVACNWMRTVESAPNLSESSLLSKFY